MAFNEAMLRQLANLLCRGPYRTAKQIAEETGWSKPSVYTRLAGLRKRGCVVLEKPIREGTSGPLSMAYRVLKKESNPCCFKDCRKKKKLVKKPARLVAVGRPRKSKISIPTEARL